MRWSVNELSVSRMVLDNLKALVFRHIRLGERAFSQTIHFETLLSDSPLKSEDTSRFQTALQIAKSIDIKATRQKSASQYPAKTRLS